MKVGAFQKFSLIDYPGHTCAIIFTQGCNFRCPFCHNPELVDPRRFERSISIETIFEFLNKRKRLLDAVEFTGGEPTLQIDLLDIAKEIKDMGFLVKLDTNGSLPDVVKMLVENRVVDYIAMDVKTTLDDYDRVAGIQVNKENIRRSIEIIRSSGVDYEFRTTVLRSYHNEDVMRGIGEMIRGAKRYYLQNGHFDKTLMDIKGVSFTKPELERFRDLMLKYVEFCEIRM